MSYPHSFRKQFQGDNSDTITNVCLALTGIYSDNENTQTIIDANFIPAVVVHISLAGHDKDGMLIALLQFLHMVFSDEEQIDHTYLIWVF